MTADQAYTLHKEWGFSRPAEQHWSTVMKAERRYLGAEWGYLSAIQRVQGVRRVSAKVGARATLHV